MSCNNCPSPCGAEMPQLARSLVVAGRRAVSAVVVCRPAGARPPCRARSVDACAGVGAGLGGLDAAAARPSHTSRNSARVLLGDVLEGARALVVPESKAVSALVRRARCRSVLVGIGHVNVAAAVRAVTHDTAYSCDAGVRLRRLLSLASAQLLPKLFVFVRCGCGLLAVWPAKCLHEQ